METDYRNDQKHCIFVDMNMYKSESEAVLKSEQKGARLLTFDP